MFGCGVGEQPWCFGDACNGGDEADGSREGRLGFAAGFHVGEGDSAKEEDAGKVNVDVVLERDWFLGSDGE